MIPSGLYLFNNSSKFKSDDNSNIQFNHMGVPISGIPGQFPGAYPGGYQNGVPGGYGGGYPGQGFPGRDGRPNFHDRSRGHYDPGDAIREHIERLNNRHREPPHRRRRHANPFEDRAEEMNPEHNPDYNPEHMNPHHNEDIERQFMNQMPETERKEEPKQEPKEEPIEKKDDFSKNSAETNQNLNEKPIEMNQNEAKAPEPQVNSGTIDPIMQTRNSGEMTNGKEFKTILLWTPIDESVKEGNQAFIDGKCVTNKCVFVTNKSLLDKSDAIVFSARHLPTHKPPAVRPRHQKWIFFSDDSPQFSAQEDLNSLSL
ncbi:unnamed protein product, partial [Medioppia subpectinata]